ncbi:ABC1 kinase family protein [Sinimarinibacterium flocculans]|uniref:Putative unusual protein kinase regulating ubiquinone biosynthesis (AarF/ABC1/UbiB family) n=1 Tax=Sinimarinibacterium flocculans TaxID=985250 RepID=A0A318EF44_9GAMM|nr:AarF/ABC1/UbiB kinase family protein [Sinimarinibacterium flocculans]PXV71417.1 putative unusual protein kinase regulating ubiquinone biosynthesis (AarF/ABC1/UbiB family) [Sinimarinibacterium flocculans]
MSSRNQNGAKGSIPSLKTGPFERSVALTRLGVGAGAKIMAHSIANIFRGEIRRDDANREFYRRQAQVLADELGKLKGSVMKAGQMLSLYGQYFLPEEAVTVLSSLQDDTPPVDWKVVRPVLERALGRRRLQELEVDETPLAAASLGQVHRARRRTDGLELCVKIQYPGVADAIESDIRTLSRLLIMTRLTPRGLDITPVFNEVREMLHREVDYESERHFTETFAARLGDDPRFVVPRVIGEYCSDQVLTTSYEHGLNVRDARVRALDQSRRDRLGSAFLELFLTEFFDWGMVQSDPHFGNYRIRLGDDAEGDRFVLLDFGATRVFGRGFIDSYAEIVRGALARDRNRLKQGAVAIGLMQPGFPRAVVDAFAEMCELIVEPFAPAADERVPEALRTADGRYRWGASDLPMRASRMAAINALSVHFRVPPREIVFLHRRLAGVFIMLAALHCEVDGRDTLLQALGRAEERSPRQADD